MEEIINFLTEFCNLHSSLAYIFGFLFLCFVDNKLPEDSNYKLLTKFLTFIGNIMNKETVSFFTQKIEEVNSRIDKLENKLDNETEERQHDSVAQLRHSITSIYHITQRDKYILESDKENYNDLYKRYIANGGNSYIEKDVDPYINSLPRFMTHEEAKMFFENNGNYNNGTEGK